jgi:hypothetical protein
MIKILIKLVFSTMTKDYHIFPSLLPALLGLARLRLLPA